MNKNLLLLSAFFLLAGCGNDSETEIPIEQIKTVPVLNATSVALTPLKSADSNDFERHLKNGVYLNSTRQNDVSEAVVDSVPTADAISDSSKQSGYSSTITQEVGVDEGDRIKYDGEYMYIANYEYYQKQTLLEEAPTSQTSVRILQRDTQGDLNVLSNTVVNEDASSINSLYLKNNTLAVLSNIYNYSIASTM